MNGGWPTAWATEFSSIWLRTWRESAVPHLRPDIRISGLSPDGASVALHSAGFRDSRSVPEPSSGAAGATASRRNQRVRRTGPDGKLIVFSQTGDNTKDDLWLLPLDGTATAPVFADVLYENQGQFSPDGRWMAYTSDESGQFQVYVQPIPPNGAKWQISSAGGSQPRWRPDGKELFYAAPDRKLMAVPVKIDSSFAAGVPVALFEGIDLLDLAVNRALTYRPAADGQRFLVSAAAGGDAATATSLTVVTNWIAGFKK
jgi:hypothetical protein